MKKSILLIAAALATFGTALSPAHGQKLRMPAQTPPASQQPDQTSDAKPDSTAAEAADAQTPATTIAEILVQVNGQIISKQDLARADEQITQQGKEDNWTAEELEQKKKELLSDLIDQQLLLSRGKELGINADDELIRRLDEVRKQNHLASMEELEQAVKSQGVSFEDFRQNMRNSILTQQVIRDEVGRSIHLTASEAEAYYQAHKDQFTQPESVHLSEILIPAGTTDAELANAQARAGKVEDELKKGADFSEMAKSISVGPTATQGGDLGVFKRGQLAKELEDKTFVLQKGQITEPVRTRQGLVILKVLDHTPEGLQPFKDVEEQVTQQVYVERMQPALRAYLTKLRQESIISIKPGYTDANATANETKSDVIFSAYTPPVKKAKKVKISKARFRDKSVMAKDRPPAPPRPKDYDDTVTAAAKNAPAGGPTAVGVDAYKTTEKQQITQANTAAKKQSAAKAKVVKTSGTVSRTAANPNATPKKYKVRFGQGEKAAQLPENDADTAAKANTNNVEARLSPESKQLLGDEDDTPHKKTRFQTRPVEPRKAVKAEKAEAKAETKKANAPPPPDATEVARQAINSAPLGLNGNTAQKTKAKLAATGEKQRIEDKKPSQVAQNKNTNDTEKKRHKLLGIL